MRLIILLLLSCSLWAENDGLVNGFIVTKSHLDQQSRALIQSAEADIRVQLLQIPSAEWQDFWLQIKLLSLIPGENPINIVNRVGNDWESHKSLKILFQYLKDHPHATKILEYVWQKRISPSQWQRHYMAATLISDLENTELSRSSQFYESAAILIDTPLEHWNELCHALAPVISRLTPTNAAMLLANAGRLPVEIRNEVIIEAFEQIAEVYEAENAMGLLYERGVDDYDVYSIIIDHPRYLAFFMYFVSAYEDSEFAREKWLFFAKDLCYITQDRAFHSTVIYHANDFMLTNEMSPQNWYSVIDAIEPIMSRIRSYEITQFVTYASHYSIEQLRLIAPALETILTVFDDEELRLICREEHNAGLLFSQAQELVEKGINVLQFIEKIKHLLSDNMDHDDRINLINIALPMGERELAEKQSQYNALNLTEMDDNLLLNLTREEIEQRSAFFTARALLFTRYIDLSTEEGQHTYNNRVLFIFDTELRGAIHIDEQAAAQAVNPYLQGINVHTGERDRKTAKAIQLLLRKWQPNRDELRQAYDEFNAFLESHSHAEKAIIYRVFGRSGYRQTRVDFGGLMQGKVTSGGLDISGKDLLAHFWHFAATFPVESDRDILKAGVISALIESLEGVDAEQHVICNPGKLQHLAVHVLQGYLPGAMIDPGQGIPLPPEEQEEDDDAVMAEAEEDEIPPMISNHAEISQYIERFFNTVPYGASNLQILTEFYIYLDNLRQGHIPGAGQVYLDPREATYLLIFGRKEASINQQGGIQFSTVLTGIDYHCAEGELPFRVDDYHRAFAEQDRAMLEQAAMELRDR